MSVDVVRLAELSTVEARDRLTRAGVAIVPVGAIEQHGPHLALETDARIADEFAARLAHELGDRAVLCPLIPYGISDHHQDFAGTITVRATTFIELVLDVVTSLRRNGLERVVIVNGHGGNMPALNIVSSRARTELGLPVATLMWARLASDVIADGAAGAERGHACESETSLAMALAPPLLRSDDLPEPEFLDLVPPDARPPRGFVDLSVAFGDLTANGVWGRPRASSPEFGERILSAALERAVRFTREFMGDATTPA